MSDWMIYGIGFTAQFIFASRVIIQWFQSEKAHKLKTPVIFWKLSLIAAIIFFIYGYLRKDFSIMLGQAIIYSVFIRNLQLQHEWKPTSWFFKLLVLGFPVFAVVYGFLWAQIDFNQFFSSDDIATWLLLVGVFGQILYTGRFIYQWIYSEHTHHSDLPVNFWVISLTGSAVLIFYAVVRMDPVLFASHAGGSVIYIRNIYIGVKQKK